MPRADRIMSTMAGPMTLEELLPVGVPLPRPIIPDGVKTAMVRLKVDYWPTVEVENHVVDRPGRLLAGQVVPLPIDEAKRLVAIRAAELTFGE
jgi:hypothetical protein